MRTLLVPLMVAAGLTAQDSTGSRGWLERGKEAVEADRNQDAVAAFQKASDLNPASVIPRLYLAGTLLAGDPDSAARQRAELELLRVLQVEPENRFAPGLLRLVRPVLCAPAPPEPAGTKPARPQTLRVTGNVQSFRLIDGPQPDYPLLARQARIQGTVALRVLIAADGTVSCLDLISGHPLLVPAAMDAVKRWRYRPTIVNLLPMEVLSEVRVNFSLAEGTRF